MHRYCESKPSEWRSYLPHVVPHSRAIFIKIVWECLTFDWLTVPRMERCNLWVLPLHWIYPTLKCRVCFTIITILYVTKRGRELSGSNLLSLMVQGGCTTSVGMGVKVAVSNILTPLGTFLSLQFNRGVRFGNTEWPVMTMALWRVSFVQPFCCTKPYCSFWKV